MSLLRVYDGGKPVNWPHHLPIHWRVRRRTSRCSSPATWHYERLLTVAQLDSQRAALPLELLWSSELRAATSSSPRADRKRPHRLGPPAGPRERHQGASRAARRLLAGPLIEQKRQLEAGLRARAGLAGPQDHGNRSRAPSR